MALGQAAGAQLDTDHMAHRKHVTRPYAQTCQAVSACCAACEGPDARGRGGSRLALWDQGGPSAEGQDARCFRLHWFLRQFWKCRHVSHGIREAHLRGAWGTCATAAVGSRQQQCARATATRIPVFSHRHCSSTASYFSTIPICCVLTRPYLLRSITQNPPSDDG